MTARENFKTWFSDQIDKLIEDREAGFAIAMITFPLLERYLRRKTNATPKEPQFILGLLAVIPELGTVKASETFWCAYRHGLLHNVVMSKQSHGLRHDSAVVAFDGERVWLNPILFARRVIGTIDGDFDTFEGGQPLPTVTTHQSAPASSGVSSIYTGTTMPISAGTRRHDG